MEIIRNLYESDKVIQPSNSIKSSEMYLCCMKNVEWENCSMIICFYKYVCLGVTRALVVLRMIVDLFSYYFPRNTKQLMMVNITNYTRIKDFGTHYTCEGRVASFQKISSFPALATRTMLFYKHVQRRSGPTWSPSLTRPILSFICIFPLSKILGFPLPCSKQRFWWLQTTIPPRSLWTAGLRLSLQKSWNQTGMARVLSQLISTTSL